MPPKPIGRQGSPPISGGQADDCGAPTEPLTPPIPAIRRSPVRVALVTDDDSSAIAAMGGAPMLPAQVVIIWRVDGDEAQRGLEAGRYDCITYSKAIDGCARDIQSKTLHRSILWRGLDGEAD